MKKIFTLLLCSALFAGSCWGATDVVIGSGTSTYDRVPLYPYYNYGLTQFIYLKSEIGTIADKKISKIKFKALAGASYTRSIKVYIENTAASDLSSNWIATTHSAVFDGSVTVPATSDWYEIKLSGSFVWDGTSNLLFTIVDNTNRKDGQYGSYKQHFVYSGTNRSRASGSTTAKDPTNPSGGYSSDSNVPQITITFTTDEPGSNPTITVPTSVNLGTFDKQYEQASKTFTVKGSDLKADVSISADAGLEVSPSSISKEAITAAGTTGVEVTVKNTNAYSFTTAPKVTISSTDATSQIVTINGTTASYSEKSSISFLKNAGEGSYCTLSATPTISNVDGTNKVITLSKFGTIDVDYSTIGGSYAVNGTISNLKGKLINENLFKAFSFTYTAPVVTGITIDENADNSAIIAANDGQIVDVNIKRTFKKGMYNTICLPITVTHSILQGKFGYEMSLIGLSGSSYNGSTITLEFSNITGDLVAGKPYLLKPSTDNDVVDPVFSNYEVSKAIDTTTTTYVDFIPLMSLTELPQSKEILFMGQNNELFWPTEAGTLKGLRCYFQVKNTAVSGAPVRMVVNKDNTVTNVVNVNANVNVNRKVMLNGQLIIIRDGVQYNATGQMIK